MKTARGGAEEILPRVAFQRPFVLAATSKRKRNERREVKVKWKLQLSSEQLKKVTQSLVAHLVWLEMSVILKNVRSVIHCRTAHMCVIYPAFSYKQSRSFST